MFFRHAEASSYYLEDDPEYDDEIDEEFEKFLLEKEAQLQWFKKENILCSFCELGVTLHSNFLLCFPYPDYILKEKRSHMFYFNVKLYNKQTLASVLYCYNWLQKVQCKNTVHVLLAYDLGLF